MLHNSQLIFRNNYSSELAKNPRDNTHQGKDQCTAGHQFNQIKYDQRIKFVLICKQRLNLPAIDAKFEQSTNRFRSLLSAVMNYIESKFSWAANVNFKSVQSWQMKQLLNPIKLNQSSFALRPVLYKYSALVQFLFIYFDRNNHFHHWDLNPWHQNGKRRRPTLDRFFVIFFLINFFQKCERVESTKKVYTISMAQFSTALNDTCSSSSG